MNRKTIGILAVTATAGLGAALIGWSVYSGVDSAAEREDARRQAERQMGPAPVIDAQARPLEELEVEDVIGEAGGGRIQGLDPDDEGRIAYEIFYERLDPARAGRFNIDQPEAWIYFDEGAAAQVVARTGTLVSPAGAAQPESGRFEGDVVIRIFPPPSEGDAPAGPIRSADAAPDTPPAQPVATIESDALGFDTAIGEISTTSTVRISANGVEARLEGLKILLDEPGERIAYLGAERGGVIRIDPTALRRERERAAPADEEGASIPADPQPAAETIYALEIAGDLTLASGPRTMIADRLDAWARLIDGALPPNAIATIVAPPDPADNAATTNAGSAPVATSDAARAAPITLTWQGPLVVRPAEETPAPLTDDHLAIAVTSPESGGVRLTDDELGASVECIELRAGLTRAVATLAGRGETGVTLAAPDIGRLVVGRIDVDAPNGLATLEGRAQVEAVGAAAGESPDRLDEPNRRAARWSDRATLVLATRDRMLDLDASPFIRSAVVEGDVVGAFDGVDVEAAHVRADFAPSASRTPVLSRVVLTDDVRLEAGADGELTTDRLDVSFAPGASGDAVPRFATAAGSVRAVREGATLLAELAEVALLPDETGALTLERFTAERGVTIEREDGFSAAADELRLDAGGGVAEVLGAPALLRYREASLTAGHMRFEQEPRRLTCFGAGVLNHSRLREGSLGYERVQIEWNERMTYDDDAGRAEFIGSCLATAEPSDLARDLARAHRIILDLTPGLTRDQQTLETIDRAAANDDDETAPQLLRVHAFGASAESEAGARVEIESRRFTLDSTTPSGLRLTRLFYVEGDELIADAEADTLDIPGDGRLLIEERPARSPADESDGAALAGTTLFEWRGALHLNRSTGDAKMTNRVRLRHKPLGGDRVTELECEHISAALAPVEQQPRRDPDAVGPPELIRAQASGAVYVAQEGRQLIADALTYDAERGVASATCSPGNLVTLFDRSLAAPLTGSVLRWDLKRDRIEWFDAGELTAPN